VIGIADTREGAIAAPNLLLGAALTLTVVLIALVSLLWTPGSPEALDIPHKLAAPSALHWFGTDALGRDVLSMVMAGARGSLLIALVAVTIGAVIGTGLGLLAAALRGGTEELVMRFTDFIFAFPAILSAIMLTAWLGPGAGDAIVAIGIFNIPVFTRVTRAEGRAIWTRQFVLAAQATGRSRWQISLVHVLPNLLPTIIVQTTVQLGTAILAEAALSYLGLGTQPPTPSWGRMLYDAQTLLFQAPRLAIFPGLAIAISVLGLNLLGDGLRDRLDPRLRWRPRRPSSA
jgi:peptide/nickel transport system permease protein